MSTPCSLKWIRQSGKSWLWNVSLCPSSYSVTPASGTVLLNEVNGTADSHWLSPGFQRKQKKPKEALSISLSVSNFTLVINSVNYLMSSWQGIRFACNASFSSADSAKHLTETVCVCVCLCVFMYVYIQTWLAELSCELEKTVCLRVNDYQDSEQFPRCDSCGPPGIARCRH